MDGLIFVTAVKDAARLRTCPRGCALALHADQILMQVAPERAPNGIVVVDAGLSLFSGVAFEAEAEEFDYHFIRGQGRDDIAAQPPAPQVEVHAGEDVDHVPLVRRQMRE